MIVEFTKLYDRQFTVLPFDLQVKCREAVEFLYLQSWEGFVLYLRETIKPPTGILIDIYDP